MTPLQERMIGDLCLRNLAENTIEFYSRAVRRYAGFSEYLSRFAISSSR